MKIYIKEPGQVPRAIIVPNDLYTLQQLVDGYIEVLTLFEDLAVICDEEGRRKDKPYNCEICGITFVGTILLVGVDGEEFTDAPESLAYALDPEGGGPDPMKTIVKKVGKKAVLADLPDDCKRLSALAEYLEADLASTKISADTVVIFDKAAGEEQHNVTLGGQAFCGDILLLGSSGVWLKEVDLEIYTNRSLLPALWAKPKITNEKKEVDA